MKVIVGLGNPDKKYDGTRHNAGFLAIDQLAADKGLTWQFNKSFNAQVAKGLDFHLVKPATYMNNSGEAVQKVLAYYHVLPVNGHGQVAANANLVDSLVVIHDDLDIALGAYKYSTGGSAGGHNGVQSIINSLGTASFGRLRLGIATPELAIRRKSIWPNSVARFVLKKFSASEKELLAAAITKALNTLS